MASNEYQYPASEGLQVVPAHEGLQVVPAQPGLEVAHSGGLEKIDKAGNPAYQGIEVAPADGLEGVQPARAGTYCGLRKRTFAIVAGIILLVVIVAAVVGGVVGSRHSTSNNTSSPDNPAVSDSTSTGTSPTKTASQTTTSSHSTTTTSTGPIPTTPLAVDCPAINATSRAIKSSKSEKAYDFDLYCNSNFAPGKDTGHINATSLNDCVEGCINLIELGAPCVGVVWDSILNLAIGLNEDMVSAPRPAPQQWPQDKRMALWPVVDIEADNSTSGGNQNATVHESIRTMRTAPYSFHKATSEPYSETSYSLQKAKSEPYSESVWRGEPGRINMAGNVFAFLTAPIGFATVLLLRGRVEGSFDMGLALDIPAARKVCHRDIMRLLGHCLHDTVGVIFVGSMAQTNVPSRHRETCMHKQAYHDDHAEQAAISKLDRSKAAEAIGDQVLNVSLTRDFGFMGAREHQNGPDE
ncbi:hypothetical protein V502_07298 [Pseudogymnoascus sp. VKM F-4520 (FW-2644)]|nr:hypothetical protein V502_07298 [Pseudogymnoascus sp. VKM F-4520 (FW-2644)]